jgi:hypothetical protein
MKTELSTRDRARQAAASGAPRAGQRPERTAGQDAPPARGAQDSRLVPAAGAARRGLRPRPGRRAGPGRPAVAGRPVAAGRPAAGRPAASARGSQGATQAPPRRPAEGGADPRTAPQRARPASAGARAASTVTEPLPRPARRPRPGLSRPALSRPTLSRPGGGTAAGPGRVAGEAARRAAAARRLGGSRTPFVLLVLGLLGGGLVCLLVINTTLSAASYQINTLQQGNAQLSQQEQALQQQIAKEQAPATIQKRAYQLGMRPEQRLNFVNARTGKVSRQPGVLRGVPNAPGFTP